MVDRTPAAARQLASRARRRVRGAEPARADHDRARQRQVADAFFAAARAGDFESLVALLHPDVVLKADFGPGRPAASIVIRGAAAVARQARLGATPTAELHPVLVNGAAGALITRRGQAHALMAFTVLDGQIVEIDVIGDRERVRRLASAVLPR